jgi:hypothetical protein
MYNGDIMKFFSKIPLGLITLLVLACAVCLGFFYVIVSSNYQQKETNEDDVRIENVGMVISASVTPSVNDAVEPAAAFTYGQDGFSPDTVSIRIGQKVLWRNDSSYRMSIGVVKKNDDATAVYPEFVQNKAVTRDGLFIFIFRKSGTWVFENKERPKDRGTVIVSE